MNLPPAVVNVRKLGLRIASSLGWLGPLLARLTVGLTFMSTGWGKLHSLPDVTEYFASLHIPAPHFNALLAASAEFFCGTALVLGLLTRLAALPLVITMVVAIVTAKLPKVDGFFDFVGLEEWTYITIFVWLALAGPGAISLDRLLARKLSLEPAPRA